MFNKRNFVLVVVFALAFVVLALPTIAQDMQEPMPVSATFSYTWTSPMMAVTDDYVVFDGIEPEVWFGDLEGTSDAIWRVTSYTSPLMSDVWLMSEFTGTLFGEYEGTMTILLVGDMPEVLEPWAPQWFGEWAIIDGTGDFENAHGAGIWWGPGNGPNADQEHLVPEIALNGEIVFMEPTS